LLPLEPGTLFSCELPFALIPVVRKIGSQRNKIKQNGNKTQKIHNTIETQIYVVHPVWATSTREISRSFLFIIQQNEGIQPTTHRCNFLFFLSQSPLSEYNIHNNTQLQYNSLIKEGFLLGKKTLK
jgi:hypothetical protein